MAKAGWKSEGQPAILLLLLTVLHRPAVRRKTKVIQSDAPFVPASNPALDDDLGEKCPS